VAILVNGREYDEHGLHARAEARKRSGLHDARLLRLLEREIVEEIEEHASSMIRVVYDLEKALDDYGRRLEPPPDLSREGEEKGRLESFLRRLQTRFIRAVCEGYVQQQEKFNTYAVRGVDLSYREISGSSEGMEPPGAAGRRQRWLSSRPAWDEETVREVISLAGEGMVVVVGIPGLGLLEALAEERRLVAAVDNCDRAVAEAQSRILPAHHHHLPVRMLSLLHTGEPAMVVISFPECLTGVELQEAAAWSREHLAPRGLLLLALNRGWSEVLAGDDGFVRYWPSRFLLSLVEEAGMEASVAEVGKRMFIKGEVPG
jgi:hypothetical protein